MSAVELKLISLAVIFLTGLTGGWASLRLEDSARREALFSLGSAMAAGIFLGAGLIHMLPDAADGFQELLPRLSYPLAFLLSTCGFLIILLLEKVLLRRFALERLADEVAAHAAVYPYTLVLVLSLHSVLAGIALGAEDTAVGSLAIFLAIIAHKGSAAFAMGVSLHRGGLERSDIIKIVAFFSMMTPLGVGLGLGFDAFLTGRAAEGFEAVFDSLAAGTFLYIASLDIIQEEFFDPVRRSIKFALLALGLSIMALVAVWL